ncbi:MAG: DUF4368 domain-containing protein [Anaerobutyricum hallii]
MVLFFWVWVVDKLSADTLLNILVFCAIFSLALFSPIDSERRHLNTDQKKQYRIITIFITIIFWVIYELLLYMEFEVYAVCIAEGIMLTAILQIPCVVKKYERNLTCKNKTLNEDNRYKWNKATLTHILTRQEYCGDVVNFKTTKHFRDKRNHYVDRSQWHITENVHEPIIDRTDFENVQRILENAPVKRPNGDGEIHPLSGLLFCKDCGAKMHIRIDYRNGGKRHVAYCSEYHKGKAKNPKCSSPHIMDADLLMQTVADVLKKIAEYSISNRAEFEALVKKSLAMQQTDKTKKQQKRIPQITTRLEQIDKVLNKLYEDNALGTIPQDRYEQMSQKYSEEYYSLKAELEQLREQLSAFENAGGRAQKFVKLIDRYADFTDLTPTILNEFISRIEVHERDKKRAKQAIQHIGIYFNHIGRFENELTQLAEPTEQEIRQMREEIEEARKEKSRAYHRNYSREYRARNLEKKREYDRIKAREYRAKKKAQAAAALSAP